jgi:Ca2+-binding EF-hand superfamily protein
MVNEEEIKPITEQFHLIDATGSGMISREDLQKFMSDRNHNLSKAEIDAIIKELDYKGNGMINYTEFLSATLDI